MQFSNDGKQLVTGGSDAIVGLWDCGSTLTLQQHGHAAAAASMVCTTTITRRLKFIRSTAFSHDSQLLAIATEEDGIDVADATPEPRWDCEFGTSTAIGWCRTSRLASQGVRDRVRTDRYGNGSTAGASDCRQVNNNAITTWTEVV
jgi:WD40 repeat protein